MSGRGQGQGTMERSKQRTPQVVVCGGGFGGLNAARALRRAPVAVTLVDSRNHHLFQPLLYQVAMAGLSPSDIASPLRSVLRRQDNVRVLLDQLTGCDLAERRVSLRHLELRYDYLILATGAQTSYFGHDEWARFAPGLKDADDAIEIRRRVLLAFEAAEREPDAARAQQLMTFIVIGGGPTGVELAGALAELSRHVLARDFRTIDPGAAQVLLLEAGPRILPTFAADLSEKAAEQLRRLGVEVRTSSMVTGIDEYGVHLGIEYILSRTVLWAAGVRATPLPSGFGVAVDRAGRVAVEPDLSLASHPEVFVIGDAAAFLHDGGQPLPGVAPVAIQQGQAAARAILADLRGARRERFRYHDRGNMATIGRAAGVVQSGRLRLNGLLAWLAWLMVHVVYLIGFRNRFVVLFNWFWSYVTYQRGARLITGARFEPGPPAATEKEPPPMGVPPRHPPSPPSPPQPPGLS